MTNFIPIFPLKLVVYPGEKLNLHIFEPRYQQLIRDCLEKKQPFGLPVVINNKIDGMGTLLSITELSKQYKNGKMDIKTEGIMTFKILEIIKDIPDKLYQGAIVTYPKSTNKGNAALMRSIVEDIRKIHKYLHVEKAFNKPDEALTSYDVAHEAGLSFDDEYFMLQLQHERQRQELLKRRLAKVMPVLQDMKLLKEKIKLNGHFKNIKGLNL